MARKARRAEPVVEAESDIEVVSKPGMGIDEGIVLTTFFLLAGAITMVILANQVYTATN